MKKVLGYISVVLLMMSISSCEDNSLQKRLDDEKDLRVDFVNAQNAESDPDFTQTTTGLYYKIVKANNEEVENYENEKTIRDTVVAGHSNIALKVYWNFYIYNSSVDKDSDRWSLQLPVSGSYTSGDYEPVNVEYNGQILKTGFYEAFSYMKKGDLAEFVVPSTLLTTGSYYSSGTPNLGVEGQYISVHCKVRLLDIITKEDPNVE